MAVDVVGLVVMVDPDKVRDRDMLPGAIARVAFISDIHRDIAIVYFDEMEIYNAYNVKDLLVIYPEKIIFENICRNFARLGHDTIRGIFAVVTNYKKRYFENLFRICLKNEAISALCMTDLGMINRS